MTINSIHRIVTSEHRGRLMAADTHYDVIGNPRLPHIRDGTMPEIMEMKPLDFSPPARRIEVRLYVPDALTLDVKHKRASQCPRNMPKHFH